MFGISVYWACVAHFQGIRDGDSTGIFLSLFITWEIIAAICMDIWSKSFGHPIVAALVIVPIALFGLCIHFYCEMDMLAKQMHRWVPPRPMFCNEFITDVGTGRNVVNLNRGIPRLPYWKYTVPNVDRYGHWAW